MQVEFVSSHFNYTEEYVLSHTPSWVNRKSRQAQKEQFETHTQHVVEGFKSLALLIDSALNKGKSWDKILPSSLEEASELQFEKEKKNTQFIVGMWWKPKDEARG